jgi:membrane fusion protein
MPLGNIAFGATAEGMSEATEMALHELFRNEVTQARRGRWLGSVHLATPLSFVWLTALAASMAAAIVLFMVFGHYTRYARVSGQLVPSAGLLGVRSPTQGRVTRVYVHEGETVQRGTPLVEISGERESAALGSTQALISTQLHEQAQRLHARLTNQQQSAKQQASGLRTKLSMLRRQADDINGQLTLENKQLGRASAMAAKLRPLRGKGYISEFMMEQQESTVSEMQLKVKALHRQYLDTRQQIAQTQQKLKQLPLALDAKRAATHQALSQNTQKLAENELQRDTILRASSGGIIATLLVKRGQSVSAEQPLLSVLPEGSILQAQLLVPSSAIGQIKTGSRVVMRYEAFPYQEFGQQYGQVASMSRSALSNEEVTSLTGTRSSQPLYRVLVSLNRQSIDAYGKSDGLKPGMALSADILLNRRSLLQWAFAPLSGLAQQVTSGGNQS